MNPAHIAACPHGQLLRQCLLCEKDEQIAVLMAESEGYPRLAREMVTVTAQRDALKEALQRIDSIRNNSCYAKTCGQMVAIARDALALLPKPEPT